MKITKKQLTEKRVRELIEEYLQRYTDYTLSPALHNLAKDLNEAIDLNVHGGRLKELYKENKQRPFITGEGRTITQEEMYNSIKGQK